MKMKIRKCQSSDLQSIIELNETIYAALPDKSILRHNSPEMIASCLEEPNVTLGIWDGNLLVAIGMLYVPQCLEEDHFHDLGLQSCFLCVRAPVALDCSDNSSARWNKSP